MSFLLLSAAPVRRFLRQTSNYLQKHLKVGTHYKSAPLLKRAEATTPSRFVLNGGTPKSAVPGFSPRFSETTRTEDLRTRRS
jgi:hypothetical protein